MGREIILKVEIVLLFPQKKKRCMKISDRTWYGYNI